MIGAAVQMTAREVVSQPRQSQMMQACQKKI